MIYFLEDNILDICGDKLIWIVQLLLIVIRIIQIIAPLLLVLFGSLDFFKAVIAKDDKAMQEKRKPFITRLIAAVIIMLLPFLVNLIMKIVSTRINSTFATCWNKASEMGWTLTINSTYTSTNNGDSNNNNNNSNNNSNNKNKEDDPSDTGCTSLKSSEKQTCDEITDLDCCTTDYYGNECKKVTVPGQSAQKCGFKTTPEIDYNGTCEKLFQKKGTCPNYDSSCHQCLNGYKAYQSGLTNDKSEGCITVLRDCSQKDINECEKTTDDYGNACAADYKHKECFVKSNPKKCEDITDMSKCTTDDYGNKCTTAKASGSTSIISCKTAKTYCQVLLGK